tara:strand:- start:2862 stop:3098 length:237 start_codon:yes stop_codon:yes gene_type:complete
MKKETKRTINEYRFQLNIIGLGVDEDEALTWALQQLGERNSDVLEGEIVFELIEETDEYLESEVLVKPDEWVTVIPEA